MQHAFWLVCPKICAFRLFELKAPNTIWNDNVGNQKFNEKVRPTQRLHIYICQLIKITETPAKILLKYENHFEDQYN